MKALLLAGGLGTRLRPLTEQLPKPMALVGNRPWIEHLIVQLRDQGIREFVLALKHYPELIRRHLGDGSRYGVTIDYVIEQEALGTAGAIKNAEPLLDERFLVFNADIVQHIDVKPLLRFHQESGAILTIGLMEVEDPSAFGVVELSDRGEIRRFVEKPKPGETTSKRVNAGIYVMNKEALAYIPPGREVSVERETFPSLIEQGAGLYGFPLQGYWLDIGTRERYRKVHWDLLDRKLKLMIHGQEQNKGIWVGKDVRIGDGALLIPPVILGDGVRIGDKAIIGPYTVIGEGCHIAARARLSETILWDGCIVKEGAQLYQCVFGYDSEIEAGHILYEAYAQRMKEEVSV